MSHRSFGNDDLGMSCVRQRLLEPGFRARLSAMVRRRVPASDADDVLQTVMCDALAASAAPASDVDAGRFIGGIAKNKVADFHRRSRREAHDAANVEELPSGQGARAEACVLLGAIAEDVTPSAKQTLEWIVREHAGEELAQIAKEARLPAPVVRQRVSRMRRALRARWLGPALVVLLGSDSARRGGRARPTSSWPIRRPMPPPLRRPRECKATGSSWGRACPCACTSTAYASPSTRQAFASNA
jgi:DNA-directed RNA polymerase specialized sigma24 family protein